MENKTITIKKILIKSFLIFICLLLMFLTVPALFKTVYAESKYQYKSEYMAQGCKRDNTYYKVDAVIIEKLKAAGGKTIAGCVEYNGQKYCTSDNQSQGNNDGIHLGDADILDTNDNTTINHDTLIEILVRQYYDEANMDYILFSCSPKPGYEEMMVDYSYETTTKVIRRGFFNRVSGGSIKFYDDVTHQVLAHTTMYVKGDFNASDVKIDIDNGKVVISNILVSDEDAWNLIFSKGRLIIAGISGLATIGCVLGFVIQIIKLGASAGNPRDREQALKGLLWTGIGTACLGSVTIIFGMVFSFL